MKYLPISYSRRKEPLQLAYYDLTEADLGKRTKYEKYKLAWEQMVEFMANPCMRSISAG